MKKFVEIFLKILIVIVSLVILGLTAYLIGGKNSQKTVQRAQLLVDAPDIQSGNRPEEKVAVTDINQDSWRQLLYDVGWLDADKIFLLSGQEVPRQDIKSIRIEYVSEAQPYLTQQDGPGGRAFASVGEGLKDGVLTLMIHVDPQKLSGEENKDWWVGHQVIRTLNKMVNSVDKSSVLQERDARLFDKYRDLPFVSVKIDL